jgi:uncharacterized protein (PEP-CTERM system associated)
VVDPALRLSVIEGREANNFLTGNREIHDTPGWGVDWRPTERTHVSAEREQRFFGNSHSFVFEHRMPSSVWRYSDTEDVATGFNQPTAGSQGTVFDLLFAQFASQQPDPVLRAKLVSDFLQANGISPTTHIVTGSLASAPTVQRTQELSFAWTGLRDTLTVGATKSEARRLDTVAAVTDDFANGNLVRARGASIGLAHRLTPLSALNLNLSIVRTTGTSDVDATTLRSVSLAWSGRFGPRINSVIGARHTIFDSLIQPYVESAVFGTFGYQF